MFEPKSKSYNRNGGVNNSWISTEIHNDSKSSDLFSVKNGKSGSPALRNQNNRLSVSFKGNYMKENKLDYTHLGVVNIYIVYRLDKINSDRNTEFTIQNLLFGAMKITKYSNESHNKYNGCGICFDSSAAFSFGNRIDARNVIIFGANMRFSKHERNRAKSIYVLGKGEIQGMTTVGPTAIGDETEKRTTINAEKMSKTNFTEPDKKFV